MLCIATSYHRLLPTFVAYVLYSSPLPSLIMKLVLRLHSMKYRDISLLSALRSIVSMYSISLILYKYIAILASLDSCLSCWPGSWCQKSDDMDDRMTE